MNRRGFFSFLSLSPVAAAASVTTALTPKPTKLDVGNYQISAENDQLNIRRTDVENSSTISYRLTDQKMKL